MQQRFAGVHRLELSWALAALLLFATDALGQRSGGRMGSSSFGSSRSSSSSSSSPRSSSSSSWGSSSGSRSSSWGSSSGSRSSSWGSSSGSRSSGGRSYGSSSSSSYSISSDSRRNGPSPLGELIELLAALGPRGIVAALVLALIVYALYTYGPWSKSQDPVAQFIERTGFEVRRVSVGLDSSVRAQVQAALELTASEVDPATDQGRYRMLERVRDLLRANLSGVRYAGWVSKDCSDDEAESLFTATTSALNQRFDQHTRSNAQRFDSPEVSARAEEGQGFVVISIVTATNAPLPELPMWPTREAVDGALITCVPRFPQQLIALEIVWSPSVDRDRLSSAELELLYPELVLVGGAAPGRVQCKYCRCVSAQELGECPSCGSKERVPPPPTVAQQAPSTQGLAASVSSAQTVPCPQCREPVRFYEVQCERCGARLRT